MTAWPLLDDLPEADVRRLVAIARRRRFGRSEVVFHQGDPADSLHLIVTGRFAVRITTQLGDTVVFAIRRSGDAFGELALVDRSAVRSATVAALEPAETLCVYQADFTRPRTDFPSVDRVLVQLLAVKCGA